jgi:hypothetical protein
VTADRVCDTAGDMQEGIAMSGDGVEDGFEVGWRKAGRASMQDVTGGEKGE